MPYISYVLVTALKELFHFRISKISTDIRHRTLKIQYSSSFSNKTPLTYLKSKLKAMLMSHEKLINFLILYTIVIFVIIRLCKLITYIIIL